MLRTLELDNLERLLMMPEMPPITEEHKARMLTNIEKFEPQGTLETMRKNIVVGSLKAVITIEEKEKMHPLEYKLRRLEVWDLFQSELEEQTGYECIEDYETSVVDKITLPSQCILFDDAGLEEDYWYRVERQVIKMS